MPRAPSLPGELLLFRSPVPFRPFPRLGNEEEEEGKEEGKEKGGTVEKKGEAGAVITKQRQKVSLGFGSRDCLAYSH